MACPEPNSPPLIAGKYELLELLGEGGMGSIWRGRHVLLDTPVAIKLLRRDLRSPELAERFLREARAAARLGHPAIVRVTDVGETEDATPFLVMELLHGQSLARLIDREGPVRPERALQMLLPIADALAVAHRKGIVHRDVKPDNVFLALESYGVQPKLLDFGIAKCERGRRPRRLTQIGMVMGSPDYMSPEQATGDPGLDHRTDVWSFCVMLYEVMTGRLPFRAATYEAQLRAILERPLLRPVEIAPELWNILERGLAKEKDRRFQSMSELGQALAGWLLERGVLQDVCGAQLETRWLVGARKTAPAPVVAPVVAPVRDSDHGVAVLSERAAAPRGVQRVAAPLLAAVGLLVLGAIGGVAWLEAGPLPAWLGPELEERDIAPATAAMPAPAPVVEAVEPVELEPPIPAPTAAASPVQSAAQRATASAVVRASAPVPAPPPALEEVAEDELIAPY